MTCELCVLELAVVVLESKAGEEEGKGSRDFSFNSRQLFRKLEKIRLSFRGTVDAIGSSLIVNGTLQDDLK